MARTLVPLVSGVEEMEAVIVIDMLRRAGWSVTSAAIDNPTVLASRGIQLICDSAWDEIDPNTFNVLVIPGGAEGAQKLSADNRILTTIRLFAKQHKTIAAICAGPLVLQAAGVLKGRKATCHPAVCDQLQEPNLLEDRVVVDGNIITSRGPGTAIEFTLQIIRSIDGDAKANEVAKAMVV